MKNHLLNKSIKFCFSVIALLMLTVYQLSAQVSVSGGTSAAGSYSSLSGAFTAINATSLSSSVTVTLTSSYTETASVLIGGSTINGSTSSSNTITVDGAGYTVTAPTGTTTTTDGIIVIQGTDYVTIQNITLQENSGNTTTTQQMEWGVGIVKLSASDGAQNISVSGCTISLNKTNTASVGIYGGNHIATSVTALTIASSAGTNANIKINNNTISNAYIGIQVSGYTTTATYYDSGLEIGSSTGNTISNYGGGLEFQEKSGRKMYSPMPHV